MSEISGVGLYRFHCIYTHMYALYQNWVIITWIQNLWNVHFLKQAQNDRGLSWSWSYGSWIYNYLCNQYLSLLRLWVQTLFMAMCTQYNIMWSSLSVTCDRSVVFFLHVLRFPPLLNVALNTINQPNTRMTAINELISTPL